MASAYLEEEFWRVDWQPVDSSNLRAVGYTPGLGFLWVMFKGAGGIAPVYVYFHVPPAVYQGLLSAGSKGQYFDRNVKKALYGFEKVR